MQLGYGSTPIGSCTYVIACARCPAATRVPPVPSVAKMRRLSRAIRAIACHRVPYHARCRPRTLIPTTTTITAIVRHSYERRYANRWCSGFFKALSLVICHCACGMAGDIGDVEQQGGTFVFDGEGKCVYAFRAGDASEQPKFEEVFSAIEKAKKH